MHDERSSLLAQVPLTVSPFINLPKAPTLPHNYTSLPSTLPPSVLSPPASDTSYNTSDSNPPPPQYITSSTGFRAHPSQIIAQNRALLSQLESAPRDAAAKVEEWERGIRERELAEKRRRAPGWLDREEKILEPDRGGGGGGMGEAGKDMQGAVRDKSKVVDLMGDDEPREQVRDERTGQDLGDLMDRAFS